MALFSAGVAAEVRDDFATLWINYSKYKRVRADVRIDDLKYVHRYAFSIFSIANAIPMTAPEHERIFLQESASDSVHMLHSLLTGDSRGSRFYIRSIIENIWRHFYFMSHPVEYGWLHTRVGYYMAPEALREYCKQLDFYKGGLKNSFDALTSHYSQLSKSVHSTSATSLILRATLADILTSKGEAADTVKVLENLGRDVILLLLILHKQTLGNLNPRHLRFLIEFLDRPRKQIFVAA